MNTKKNSIIVMEKLFQYNTKFFFGNMKFRFYLAFNGTKWVPMVHRSKDWDMVRLDPANFKRLYVPWVIFFQISYHKELTGKSFLYSRGANMLTIYFWKLHITVGLPWHSNFIADQLQNYKHIDGINSTNELNLKSKGPTFLITRSVPHTVWNYVCNAIKRFHKFLLYTEQRIINHLQPYRVGQDVLFVYNRRKRTNIDDSIVKIEIDEPEYSLIQNLSQTTLIFINQNPGNYRRLQFPYVLGISFLEVPFDKNLYSEILSLNFFGWNVVLWKSFDHKALVEYFLRNTTTGGLEYLNAEALKNKLTVLVTRRLWNFWL